jgi:hypothetical protein
LISRGFMRVQSARAPTSRRSPGAYHRFADGSAPVAGIAPHAHAHNTLGA